MSSEFSIFSQTVAKTIDSLRDSFSGKEGKGLCSPVHGNTWNAPLLSENIYHRDSICNLLVNSFIEENLPLIKQAMSRTSRKQHPVPTRNRA